MGHFIVGLMLVVAATGAPKPGPIAAQEMPLTDFSDWYFAYCSAQRALGRGDVDAASRRYREAIRVAWPFATRDPRLLARTYSDFALVLLLQGRTSEAEPLAQWALRVREEHFGKQSEPVAATLHVLAQLASAELQYGRAEDLLTRAVAIWEQRLASDHPQLVIGLSDLAALYRLDRKYPQAERIFRRVLEMPASAVPINHPYRAINLIGLGSTYLARGEYDRAEATEFLLLVQMDRMSAADYKEIAPALDDYLSQLHKLGRTSEAQALESSARAARAGQNRLILPIPSGPRRRLPPVPRST